MRIHGYLAEVDAPEPGTKPVKPTIPVDTLPVKGADATIDSDSTTLNDPVAHTFAQKKVSNPDADNNAEVAVEFPSLLIEYTYEFALKSGTWPKNEF